MLKIKIGDTWAETNGLEIPVVLRSPVFSEGKGSFIFNFSVPATDEMKKELSFFHRPGAAGANTIKKPMVLSYGALRYAGTATITAASDDTYEVSCPVENSDLAGLLKGVKLPEIDLGGVRTYSNEEIRASATMAANYVIDESDPEDFNVLFAPTFSAITTNTESELQVDGKQFIPEIAAGIILTFNLYAWENLGTDSVIMVMVNSVVKQTIPLNKSPHEYVLTKAVAALQAAAGDVITWNIYVGSVLAAFEEYRIDFTLRSDSNISVSVEYIDTENDGLQLYPSSDFARFPIENSKLFDNMEDDTYMIDHMSAKDLYSRFFNVANYYKNDSFPVLLDGEIQLEEEGAVEYVIAYNLLVPFPYLAYVMKQLFRKLGIGINNNVFEDNDMRQLVIFNAYAENNFISDKLIAPTPGMDLKDHVPDVVASDYFVNLCKLFGIAYDYNPNTRILRLKYLKDIAADTSYSSFPGIIVSLPDLKASPYKGFRLVQPTGNDDFIRENFKSLKGLTYKGEVTYAAQLPRTGMQINDCYYITRRHEFWIWNYDTEYGLMNWYMHSKNFFFEFEQLDDEAEGDVLEIKTNINPIMDKGWEFQDFTPAADTGREWLIPRSDQAGIFDGLPDFFRSEFSNSLLYYHGLRKDNQENLYPLGSCDRYDFLGNTIDFEGTPAYIHDLALRWEGPHGIYEKRYKAWLDILMRSRGTFTFKAYLDSVELSKIDLLKWYTLPGFRFMIKEIRVSLLEKSISVAEIDILVK